MSFKAPIILSFLLSVPLCAQTYTAKKFVFQHPGAFTQAQLETASGLHAGMSVTGESLSAAAQKLADSQYFDSVNVTTDGPGSGLTVIFALAPSPAAKFLPVGFVNFVWLTPAEITSAIQTSVPLYNGTMLEGSASIDRASAALKNALAAKGVQARISCDSVEPSLLHPLRVLEFRVDEPSVRVANIELTGVSPALVPLLQGAINKTARRPYNAGLNGQLTADQILGPIKDAGYATATLTDETIELEPAMDGTVPVVIHAALHAGEAYKVGAIAFAGTPLYSAENFDANSKLKHGDLAGMKELLDTLQPLNDAYLSQGFLDVVIDTHPVFDETARTVSYTVTITPGEPYTLHDITTQGLDDPAAQTDFKRGFALKPGSVYNPIYVRGFIKENTALQAFRTFTGLYKATAYPATHTVDLQMVFAGNTVNVH